MVKVELNLKIQFETYYIHINNREFIGYVTSKRDILGLYSASLTDVYPPRGFFSVIEGAEFVFTEYCKKYNLIRPKSIVIICQS